MDNLPGQTSKNKNELSATTYAQQLSQYYKATHPLTVSDAIKSKAPPLALVKKEQGQGIVYSFLIDIITDVVDYFNVGKSMGAMQIAQTAELVFQEYYFLRPDDFKLCFNNAKKGLYGKLFDRLDGGIIMEWLTTYSEQREEFMLMKHDKQSEDYKTAPVNYDAVKAWYDNGGNTHNERPEKTNEENYQKFKAEHFKSQHSNENQGTEEGKEN